MKVAIAGLGAIGWGVACQLDKGVVPGLKLVAVSAKDQNRAKTRIGDFKHPPTVTTLDKLAESAEVIVECAPSAVFRAVAEPAIKRGRVFMPLSVGALLEHQDLIELAHSTDAQIVVPTGALVGLDTVRAMAVGHIESVTLETRKPPNALAGAPHLVSNNIVVDAITAPKLVFKGNAREAARGFPANVNVAAALALAGIGPERTQVEIWADPTIDRNMQTVSIKSDSGEANMTMRNIPSAENPRTGRVVANSVIATLKRLTASLVAGT